MAIGALPEQVQDTPFEAVPWSEDTECAALQAFDIGLMPLADALKKIAIEPLTTTYDKFTDDIQTTS